MNASSVKCRLLGDATTQRFLPVERSGRRRATKGRRPRPAAIVSACLTWELTDGHRERITVPDDSIEVTAIVSRHHLPPSECASSRAWAALSVQTHRPTQTRRIDTAATNTAIPRVIYLLKTMTSFNDSYTNQLQLESTENVNNLTLYILLPVYRSTATAVLWVIERRRIRNVYHYKLKKPLPFYCSHSTSSSCILTRCRKRRVYNMFYNRVSGWTVL